MAQVKIDSEWCKGCLLCAHVCPKQGLAVAGKVNEKGYFPAEKLCDVPCTGCGLCVLVCPEIAIEIIDDDEV